MNLDPLLPTAPARVRALLLPLGLITAERFNRFVARLREEHVVYLRDITADGRPNRNMFSPLAYPDGIMFYDLSTHMPPSSHLALWPFDLHREPLVIVAIVDGVELRRTSPDRQTPTDRQTPSEGGPSPLEQNLRALYQQLEGLRDDYPKALVHRVVVFDHDHRDHVVIPEGIAAIPPEAECTRTTIKTVMCDLSSLLLAEMTSLAKSFEALTHIESPGQSTSSASRPSGRAWTDDVGLQAKRASHMPMLGRSNSAGGENTHSSRMSMPSVPFRPASTTGTPSARPATPVKSGLSNPPLTFDDMVAPISEGRASLDSTRPATQGDAELGDSSNTNNRVSVQGFGPGSASERLRSKGRGRAAVVIGAMYLQAGRWIDALRELNEAATIARSINDHVWYGKSLELVLVTVLLMGWAGLDFVVPSSLLQPAAEKSAASNRPSSSSSSSSSLQIQEVHAEQPRHLQQLQPLIPDLLDRILGLYSRITAESLPTLPLSETVVRFCKLLSAMHLAEGRLVKASLDMMVDGTYPSIPPISPRLSVVPSREYIIRLALRAFPTSSPDVVTTVDRASILSGIASVLGPLGARRKRAVVMRELVSVLVTGLVEARMRGAAEVGIHPAAGLIAVGTAEAQRTSGLDLEPGDVEQGIDGFLASLCASYGVVSFDVAADLQGPSCAAAAAAAAADSTEARIRAQSAARFFGFPDVKLDVLRACINFCEALPDFAGVLRFASDLLRTAGSGVAPGTNRREQAWPTILRDEQIKLVDTVVRTSALAAHMGPRPLFGEYWDEFLVRRVSLEAMSASRMPVSQPAKNLAGDDDAMAMAAGPRNPFIHNAFGPSRADADADSAAAPTLVAGEPVAFRVTLQNPYDVDLDIESIRLDAEDGEQHAIETVSESLVVGPYRTQTLRLWATPRQAGSLVIIGAIVKVRGCRERPFPIFSHAWTPKPEAKTKQIGLAALARGLSSVPAPTADTVQFNVIPAQPMLVVASTSLPQSAVMVLEGERRAFSVRLRNTSTTTPVDFLLFAFEDSTQEPLKAALKNRDATTAELYEYELALVKRQALRPRGERPTTIAPGGEAVVEMELLGRPGLTSATIRIDYGHLGVPRDQVEERFFSRQMVVPLTVTVNASVELARLDVVASAGAIPRNIWAGVGDANRAADEHGYCLASFDFRNGFPAMMTVRLTWTPEEDSSTSATSDSNTILEAVETILPGHAKRMLLPVPRIRVADPFAPVPSLVPATRQRQFVVSRSVSPDAECAAREAFWFRENILARVACSWTCGDDGGHVRSGEVDLRTIQLLPRMVDALRINDVGIDVSVEDTTTLKSHGTTVFVDEFVHLRVRVTNRTNRPLLRPAVRVLPVLRHRPAGVALDHVRKFAWTGTLQRVLAGAVAPGDAVEVVVGAMALCRGEFEVGVTVEEVAALGRGEQQGQDKDGAARVAMALDGRGERARGVWSMRRPFVVVARERR